MKLTLCISVFFALLFVVPLPANAQAKLTDQAYDLVDQGKSKAAFELMSESAKENGKLLEDPVFLLAYADVIDAYSKEIKDADGGLDLRLQMYETAVDFYRRVRSQPNVSKDGAGLAEVGERAMRDRFTGEVTHAIRNRKAEHGLKASEKLLELWPKEPYAYQQAADAKQVFGNDLLAALKHIDDGLQAAPMNLSLLSSRVDLLFKLERYKQAGGALKTYREQVFAQVEDADKNANLMFTVGYYYELAGNLDFAAAYYKAALNQEPEHFAARFSMGALMVTRANEVLRQSNELPFNERDKALELKTKELEFLQKAAVHFETINDPKSPDEDLMVAMISVYSRLDEVEKLKAIQQQREDSQKKR